MKSVDKYNDGNWHTLEAIRQDTMGALKIDDHTVASRQEKGTTKPLATSDYIIFGGYSPNAKHHYQSVTSSGFEGCIDDVVILDTSVDLTRNVQAFGVMPGCPVRFASFVSFEKNLPGYVRWRNLASNGLQVNLKFRTLANDGLIFYATNDDQGNAAISFLSLIDGQLVFNSQGEVLRTSPSDVKFNDNEWHVVTATHNESALSLDIDDTKSYSTDSAPPALQFLYGSLYIGGLPFNAFTIKPVDAMPFVGCIGDATINSEIIINFANTTERPHAFLGKCKGGDQTLLPPVVEPELLPPLLPSEVSEDTVESSTQSNIVDVGIDKDDEWEEEPKLEGRITEKDDVTTTTTTQQPQTVDECRLPYHPAVDPDVKNSWLFGVAKNSRLEYRTLKGRYKDDYDFQIDIKTTAENGIIFYASGLNNANLIAVYVQNGKVHYVFDCGSGRALLVSEKKINDNEWHIVIFKRESNYGSLTVDEEDPVSGYSLGESRTINVNPPFFVGGVLPEISSIVYTNIGINRTFSGCLANFMLNGQTVGEPSEKVGVIPCSNRVESGLFFFPGNGSNLYKAVDRFSDLGQVDIQMNIKPRSTSGHLLSVHGKKDYLVLEMVNGTIKFLVKTQKGLIETSYDPTKPNSLCDGHWHNIRAVKQKNAVLLSVDHKPVAPGISGKNMGRVLSRQPIYIGGHSLLRRGLQGSTSQAQYVGCINNIQINSKPISIKPERAYGQVVAGVCPTI